jgi:DNA topoisomerase-1
VNEYLRRAAGRDFTAKDFRTWAGTVLTALTLQASGTPGHGPARRQVMQVVKIVAGRLGNTPAVCRKGYIHPDIIEAYLETSLTLPVSMRPAAAPPSSSLRLSAGERAVLTFLERRFRLAAKRRGPRARGAWPLQRPAPAPGGSPTPS